jgi:hypothetical protein
LLDRALWISGIVLELLLLVRSIQTKLFSKYPFFYTYVLFVLLQSIARFLVYHWYRQWYLQVYWYTEFIGVVVGSGLLFEIYWKGLALYPGTARVARNVLALTFVFAIGKAIAGAVRGHLWWPAQTTAELERNLRAVQAISILALVILLLAYSIPLGRNLRGIVAGYALFISSMLANLAALAYLGRELERLLAYSQQISYFLVLCIWTVSLWADSSLPASGPSRVAAPLYIEAEQETRERLKHTRLFFGKRKDDKE